MNNMTHLPKGNIDVYANATSLYNSPSINSISSNSWILNNRPTDHIAFDSSLFVQTHHPSTPFVNLHIGSTIPIESTDTIFFNNYIVLKDVLHVPFFLLNLLSASKLTKSLNCCVIMFPNFCALQN